MFFFLFVRFSSTKDFKKGKNIQFQKCMCYVHATPWVKKSSSGHKRKSRLINSEELKKKKKKKVIYKQIDVFKKAMFPFFPSIFENKKCFKNLKKNLKSKNTKKRLW